MRTCVACRTERPRAELIRIVRRPDGSTALDRFGGSSGRGAYLCADRACWRLALKRSSLERALRVTLDRETRALLEQGGPGDAITGGSHGA